MVYHSYLTVAVPAIVAFIITVVGTLFVQSYMKDAGVTAIDHNKKGKPILASGGGVAVAFGFAVGMLTYIFGSSFVYEPASSLPYLFATVVAVFLIAFVGFLDDINVKREMVKTTGMMDTRKGLKQWQKPLLTLIGAIPLMAVNAGVATVNLPLLGAINFGLFYPLIIIPLAVIFASNAFNLLGGFDGIATGTGLIAAAALLLYSFIYGTYIGSVISGVLFATLLAFFFFNVYPARVIPGDSYTYAVGTALVTVMILGSAEAFGVIIFMPWIIEFLLHLKKKFHTTDLGKLNKDGTFTAPYGKKISSWTHLIMNSRPMTEWQVSAAMWCVEIGFVALAFGMKALRLV
ncbi:MAG: hypothetical protein KGH66_02470 [Candidatus Micrarchaeota archaeon]|nr:hypothetical protein [Candidatus Micrarchaeota archaeon]